MLNQKSRSFLMRSAAVVLAALTVVSGFADPADAARRRGKAKAAATASKGLMARPVAKISETYAVGSVVVVNAERKLYYVQSKGKAITYPVAIGEPKEQWTGKLFVQSKAVNPSWTKPGSNFRVPGGPGNPLGPRALYLGWTLYRIHGTNNPGSIGSAASNGCFRMFNEHVKDLYPRVHVGAPVYVLERMKPAPDFTPVAAPVTADRDTESEG